MYFSIHLLLFIICRVLSILKMSKKSSPSRSLRACLGCSLIKSYNQFVEKGCENCNSFLKLKKNPDSVLEFTTTCFTGLVKADKPLRSWVCHFLRIGTCCPGTYAMCVQGSLPKNMVEHMEKLGLLDLEGNSKNFIKKLFRY